MSKTKQKEIKNKTALLVEDDADFRKSLKDALEQRGWVVLEAEDGEKGLEVALKEHPNVVVLDMVMSKKDGIQTAIAMRKDAWGKKASIVIVSSWSDAGSIELAMNIGIYQYLLKDVSKLETIVEKIESVAT